MSDKTSPASDPKVPGATGTQPTPPQVARNNAGLNPAGREPVSPAGIFIEAPPTEQDKPESIFGFRRSEG